MKQCFAFLTALVVMLACVLPAFAEDAETSEKELFTERDLQQDYNTAKAVRIDLTAGASSGSAVFSGDVLTITQEGIYILTGTWNGQVRISAPDDAKVQLVLDGAKISSSSSAAIIAESAGKVFLTTAAGTENSLSASGADSQVEFGNVDGTVFAKCDLTLNGLGTLEVISTQGHGIVSKDDLRITGGIISITSAKHGLSGQGSVRIAGGEISITSGTDCIHAEKESSDTEGWIRIQDGTLILNAGDDGIHAETELTITGGTISVIRSNEGLEGKKILISGGTISVTSTDDGLNASGGSDSSAAQDWGGWSRGGGNHGGELVADALIDISGGTITVSSGGDGVDSNGNLSMSGGTLYVSGPTRSGEVPIDYSGSGVITGGTVIATGTGSKMLQAFDTGSTQAATLSMFAGQNAGDRISIIDASGTELAAFTPDQSYALVIFSHPELKAGDSVTLKCGSNTTSLTAGTTDSTGYTDSNGWGSGGKGNKHGW